MKRHFDFSTGLVMLVIFFFSCSDKSSAPEPVAKAGKMIATADGAAWESAVAAAVIANGTITIVGTDASGTTIKLSILKAAAIGTYDVMGYDIYPPDVTTVTMTPQGEAAYSPDYYPDGTRLGTVTISEIDAINKTVSGKFSVKIERLAPAEKEIELKSGSFTKIPFTNTCTAKASGGTFYAKIINGVKSSGNLTLNFLADNDFAQAIVIVVPDNVATGPHDFGTLGSSYYATYNIGATLFGSFSGSVNITLHDTTNKRIEGTFGFLCMPLPYGGSVTPVTEGSFAVTYN